MPQDPLFIATASVFVFASAAAQSLTGFGFALLLVPVFSLVWDPRSAVVVSALLNGVLSIGVTIHGRREVSFWRVGYMTLGASAGIPVGLFVLSSLDPDRLRVLIGALVVLLGGLVYLGVTRPTRRERLALLAAGMFSGVLHGSTSMGGPPVVLCLLGQGHSKELMRATLIGFFGPLSLLAVAGFWWGGLVRPDVLWVSAITIPALTLGVVVGEAGFRWVPAPLFRALVALLVVGSGLLSMATGLRGL